jgi:hypothetical protein
MARSKTEKGPCLPSQNLNSSSSDEESAVLVTKQALFVTERLQLAIFLHATQRLTFAGCEPRGSGKVQFVFEDPRSIGPQEELAFDRGAEVSGSALFASQKFLRRTMSEALNNRRIGTHNEHTS